ncbi:hypothetical protein HMPREF1870_02741 [Bacteroidales bacterium KA00344]|nr:hypothetical protein HMPREF1870_02741 [Bacteroidales bacterium KA00344]
MPAPKNSGTDIRLSVSYHCWSRVSFLNHRPTSVSNFENKFRYHNI